jgi:hypothetical protein
VGSLVGADAGGVNGTTISDLVWPGGLAAGDVAVLFWTMINTSTATNPDSFTLNQQFDGSSGAIRMRFQHKILTGSEADALTLTGSVSNKQSAVLAVYRGAHPTSPVDTWAVRDETVAGATHACPQVTTGYAGCAILTAVGERSSSGTSDWTAPSGYTERADSQLLSGGLAGMTICALADDGLATVRPAGTNVTPPAWTSGNAFSTANVLTWTVSVRPLDPQRPPVLVATAAVHRAASW